MPDRRSELMSEFETCLADGSDMALDEAFLLLSSLITSEFDPIEHMVELDEIASTIASPTMEGVARTLFQGSDSFVGNRQDYHDPSNSLLDQVLVKRRGIPITLSVLMIEVSRRVGVRLSGVGMPGHFLVGNHVPIGDVPEIFVDPFDNGAIFDIEGCRSRFRAATGRTNFDRRHAAAVHPVAIVDRALNNLKGIHVANRNLDQLRKVMILRSRLPGFGKGEREEFFRLMAPFN